MNNEKVINKAVEIVGSEKKLADKIGVSKQIVNYWKTSRFLIPYDDVVKIYLVTNKVISMDDMRPDMKPWTARFRTELVRDFLLDEEIGDFFARIETIQPTSFREDQGDIDGLAENMERNGMIHAILVNDKMQIVAGERRFAAAKSLGYERIQVRCVNVDPVVGRYFDNLFAKPYTPLEAAAIIEILKKRKFVF